MIRRPPSGTRGRYLLIIVVLLLGGAFAGYVTHLLVFGADWAGVTSACLSSVAELVPGEAVAERQQALSACRASVEHRLALCCVAGSLLTLAVAALLAWLLPRRLLRRLGTLRPASEALRARAAEIADQLGVRRAPAVSVGPWDLREPFTVRANGTNQIVLPPGVRRLPAAHLDAVLRHETAHVAAGDVTLVWLTRSLLWALPLILPVPLVVAAFTGGLGDVPFWLEYAGRGALLWAAGYLLARGVMRDREHEADAHAALAGSGPALTALLGAAPAFAPLRARLRRLLAMHPSPVRRAAFLDERPPGIPAVIAVIAAALAVSVWTFGATIALSGFLATPLEPYSQLLTGLLAGALLAVTWGLALWPQSPGARPPRAAMAGLAVGVGVGLVLTLDPNAMFVVSGSGDGRELVYLPLGMAGAGGCTLALTAAAARPGLSRQWLVTAVLSAAAFAGALWIGSVMAAVPSPVFAAIGLPDGLISRLWTAGFLGTWRNVLAGGAAVFAVAIAVSLGRRAVPVAATGLLAGLSALAVRWLTPLSTVEPHQAAERDWCTAAAAGFALVLLLLGLRGAAGLGDALLAGPVAALTVAAGVLLRYLPDFEDPLFSASIYTSRALSMLALLTLTVGAAAGLIPSRPPAPGRRAWLIAVLGAAVAAALTLAVLLPDGLFLSAADPQALL
ncbi:M48 family metalloprotease [Actinoplanes sp. NBC_00393]|uniref:M48 family metalloprotease n=1 Tax=Actinoplanes sp. NBC_00393 TaxID=2975953 RepID=UPI002E1FBA4A